MHLSYVYHHGLIIKLEYWTKEATEENVDYNVIYRKYFKRSIKGVEHTIYM